MDPKDNFQGPFSTPTDHVEVTYMKALHNRLQYNCTDLYSSVAIPFGLSGRYKMTILVPAEGNGIEDVLEAMCGSGWSSLNKAPHEYVNLTIPKFKTDHSVNLIGILKKLGLAHALSPDAKYPHLLTEIPELAISTFRQKSNIDVSENGVEAAAATFAGFDTMPLDGLEEPTYKEFRADRNFVYVISASEDDIILFNGVYCGKK